MQRELDLSACDHRFTVRWPLQGGVALCHYEQPPFARDNCLVVSDVFWRQLCDDLDASLTADTGVPSNLRSDPSAADTDPWAVSYHPVADLLAFERLIDKCTPVDLTRLQMVTGGQPPSQSDVLAAIVRFARSAPVPRIVLYSL